MLSIKLTVIKLISGYKEVVFSVKFQKTEDSKEVKADELTRFLMGIWVRNHKTPSCIYLMGEDDCDVPSVLLIVVEKAQLRAELVEITERTFY